MRRALLRDEDRVPEMTVVRNEFERGENSPFQVLYKQTFATAFREHPYHHPTIGWRSDIEEVSTERLREFYDTFYHPNNATAMVIGDFDEAEALALLAREFGGIPRSDRADPEGLHGRAAAGRRAAVRRAARRPGRVGRALVAHGRGPPRRHARPRRARQHPRGRHHVAPPPGPRREDARALGDGRAVAAPRSRALLGLRSGAAGGRARRGRSRSIRQELARIAADGVTEAECAKARTQIEAEVIFDRDSTDQIAASLSEAIAVADWEWYADYPGSDPRRHARGRAPRRSDLPPRRRPDGRSLPSEGRRAPPAPPAGEGEAA